MKLKSRRSIPPRAGGATTTATAPESTCTDTGPALATGGVATGSAAFGAVAFDLRAVLAVLRRAGFLASVISWSEPNRINRFALGRGAGGYPAAIPLGLLALLALESPTLVPRLDDEMVGRPADSNQNHLGDVDLEAMCGLTVRRADPLDRAAGDPGVAEPAARVVLRGVLRRSVDRESGIAQKVLRLHRSRHHPHQELAIREFNLDPAHPRGAIPSESSQHLVAVGIENAPDPITKFGLGCSHRSPIGHANPAASTASSLDRMSA